MTQPKTYLFVGGPASGDIIQVPMTPTGPQQKVQVSDGGTKHNYRFDGDCYRWVGSKL